MDECYSTIIELTTVPVFIYLTSRANKCCACVLRAPMFFFSPSTKDNWISFLSTRLFIHTQVCNFIDILCHENKEIFGSCWFFRVDWPVIVASIYYDWERKESGDGSARGQKAKKKRRQCHVIIDVASQDDGSTSGGRKFLNNTHTGSMWWKKKWKKTFFSWVIKW